MKSILIYLIILTTIAVPQMGKNKNNNCVGVESDTTSVVEPLKPTETKYPINSIPETTKEQETALEEPTRVYVGEFELTAYCSCYKCCGEYALNRPVDENGNQIVYGATGNRLYQGVSIAVDPNIIPYGSNVDIDGVGVRIAHDCGGMIKGNRIDVYFDNHNDAWNFGRQWRDVYLVTP